MSDYHTLQLEQIDADEITCWGRRDRLRVAEVDPQAGSTYYFL